MIMLLLVKLILLLADRLGIAEVLDLEPIQIGHELHHDDGVLLAPKRHGHEQNLHDNRE